MTVPKNKMRVDNNVSKELELFLANTDLTSDQRKQLDSILHKFYNEGFQSGRIEVVMQQNLRKNNTAGE